MTDGSLAGVLTILLACFAAAAPAAAQTVTEPIENIQPDRPDFTNGTHIVDTGLL